MVLRNLKQILRNKGDTKCPAIKGCQLKSGREKDQRGCDIKF